MSYYATHRKNILDSIMTSKNDIRPGDIIEFRYKGKDKSSLQLVLCLNELARDKEKKLHALKLENISMSKFKQILNKIGTTGKSGTIAVDEKRGYRKVKVGRITYTRGLKVGVEGGSESERKTFYKAVIKQFNKLDSYRTYIGKNITAVKLIEYNFGVKQLGLKNEDLLQDTNT
jgi:hypothetical protein